MPRSCRDDGGGAPVTAPDIPDETYMREALREAEAAFAAGEVPVGAVVVHVPTGRILGRGRNTTEAGRTALGHAELHAIAAACAAAGGWRLTDCAIYVTLEPCPMCAGAILNARIPRVVCGAKDPANGAMGSVFSLHAHPLGRGRERAAVEYGCCESECVGILQAFFRERRKADP